MFISIEMGFYLKSVLNKNVKDHVSLLLLPIMVDV